MKIILKAVSIVLVALITPVLIADEPGDSGTAGNEPIVKTAEHRILFGNITLASRPVTPEMIEDEIKAVRNELNWPNVRQLYMDLHILSYTDSQVDRRKVLELWLRAIDTVDGLIGPPIDIKALFDQLPDGRIVTWGRGISQEENEKQIRIAEEANKLSAKNSLRQTAIEFTDSMIKYAATYIRMKYSSEKSDVEEVNHLLETLLSNEKRREQLKALLRTK
jgi:hypothetical protein